MKPSVGASPKARDELYIDWKVAPGELAAALSVVRATQRRLLAETVGLETALCLRSDVADAGAPVDASTGSTATVMEIHRHRDALTADLCGRIDAAQRAALARAGFASITLTGARHIERFRRID